MSQVPQDLQYTKSHEWVRRIGDDRVEIGITDHAQAALGDLVFVEPPVAGRTLAAGEACAVVESVKAASDVYSPVPGTVVESNAALADAPDLVNREPYAGGWLARLRIDSPAALAELLDARAYERLLEAESAAAG